MALSQVINYANRIEAGQIGHMALSLTNFDNNNEPAISAGSKIEIGGALFEAAGNEAIADWGGIANSSDVYIRLTVVGAAATAGFTIVAPVWSLTKQGWYDAGETMRYIGGLYKDAAGNYTIKWLYTTENTQQMVRDGQIRPLLEKTIEIGNWNMDANVWVQIAHGLASHKKIRPPIQAIIRDDADVVYFPLNTFYTDANEVDAGVSAIYTAVIELKRKTGGLFDTVNFDSLGFNRGWIYIKYRA